MSEESPATLLSLILTLPVKTLQQKLPSKNENKNALSKIMLPSNVLVKGTDEDFKSNFLREALICTGSDVDDIPFVDTCEDSCGTLPDLEC
ncbi:hypothetical protein AVEN_181195-1 [Araneus ventricosus]|uniref:Uncharacterized protein n=1 Tax=Araneus ventricosus TaxID=182803 RepID=A0A4Y2TP81_ARAVE|nr:hypothetical protein AVEN_181195-1 [Araneus ventricosus]